MHLIIWIEIQESLLVIDNLLVFLNYCNTSCLLTPTEISICIYGLRHILYNLPIVLTNLLFIRFIYGSFLVATFLRHTGDSFIFLQCGSE